MPIDPSIPLQVQPPSLDGAMKPISALLGIRQQQQQLQLGQQAMQSNQQSLQSNQIDVQEKQAMQQLLQDPSQFTDSQGNFDWNKLTPAVMKVAPVNGPKYIQGLFATQQQATAAKQSVQSLDTDSRAQVAKFLTAQVGQPPDKVASAVMSLKQAFPTLGPAVDHAMQVMQPVLQSGDQPAIDATLWRLGKAVENPTSQQTMDTPEGIGVTNNQQTSVVSTKPGTNVPQGQTIPGTEQQLQLPPTTPTVGPNNQPGYFGPHPTSKYGTPPNILDGLLHVESGGNANAVNGETGAMGPYQFTPQTLAMLHQQGYKFDPFDPQQARDAADFLLQQKLKANGGDMNKAIAAYGGFVTKDPSAYIAKVTGGNGNAGFVPSGPVPGANESKAGTIETVNQHWRQLNDQATNAPLIQGLLGNIKSLAPGAITGQEAGRKAYVNGLLNALHLGSQATGDMQKDTDLLEKNIAQLGLNTPASTDAARTLVAAARPHSTMSQAAIEEAAAQLGGQVQANLAVRNALASAKSIADKTGDPTAYNQMRQHLESIADPRAWQFQSLDPQSRADMLKKLTPGDRAQLRTNIEALEKEGLLK
jgi:hypothetical protein